MCTGLDLFFFLFFFISSRNNDNNNKNNKVCVRCYVKLRKVECCIVTATLESYYINADAAVEQSGSAPSVLSSKSNNNGHVPW